MDFHKILGRVPSVTGNNRLHIGSGLLPLGVTLRCALKRDYARLKKLIVINAITKINRFTALENAPTAILSYYDIV